LENEVTIPMTIPNILALDFDGVRCDGMREYFTLIAEYTAAHGRRPRL
jgi:hypothetical protein